MTATARPAAGGPREEFLRVFHLAARRQQELVAFGSRIFEACERAKRGPGDEAYAEAVERVAVGELAALRGVLLDRDGVAFQRWLAGRVQEECATETSDGELCRAAVAAAAFGCPQLDVPAREDRKVLVLINFTRSDSPVGTGLESLGVETLAGHLYERLGTAVKLELLDSQLLSYEEGLPAALAELRARYGRLDLVGLSVKMGGTETATPVARAIEELTRHDPVAPLFVFGASMANFNPEDLHCPPRSEGFVVPGWGEAGALEVVEYALGRRAFATLRFTEYHVPADPEGGARNRTPWVRAWAGKREEPATDDAVLRDAARPYREPFLRTWIEKGGVIVESLRGCWASTCNFCPRPPSLRLVYEFEPEFKLDELAYLSAVGVEHVNFADEDFFTGKGAASLLSRVRFLLRLAEYKARGYIDPEMRYTLDARADTLCALDDLYRASRDAPVAPPTAEEPTEFDRPSLRRALAAGDRPSRVARSASIYRALLGKHGHGREGGLPHPLELARQAGVCFFFIGLESMNQETLDHVEKGTSVEENLRAVELLRRHIGAFHAGSLAIMPLSRLDWVEDSFRTIRAHALWELGTPTLSMFLYQDSAYFARYFGPHPDPAEDELRRARRRRLLLDADAAGEVADGALGENGSVRYRYEDARLDVLIWLHRYFDRVLYPVLTRLRIWHHLAVTHRLEEAPFHGEWLELLREGRLDLLIDGGLELCEVIRRVPEGEEWQGAQDPADPKSERGYLAKRALEVPIAEAQLEIYRRSLRYFDAVEEKVSRETMTAGQAQLFRPAALLAQVRTQRVMALEEQAELLRWLAERAGQRASA